MIEFFLNSNYPSLTKSHDKQDYQSDSNSAVLSRVKSVANIAKRAAGLHENHDEGHGHTTGHHNGYHSGHGHEGAESVGEQACERESGHSGSFYRSKSMGNLAAGGGSLQRQKSVHFEEAPTYQAEQGEEGEEYLGYKASRASFTPNPMYEESEEAVAVAAAAAPYGCHAKKLASRGEYEQSAGPEEFKVVYCLLFFVDKHNVMSYCDVSNVIISCHNHVIIMSLSCHYHDHNHVIIMIIIIS